MIREAPFTAAQESAEATNSVSKTPGSELKNTRCCVRPGLPAEDGLAGMKWGKFLPPPHLLTGWRGKGSADQKSELRPAPACPSIPVTAIPPHLGAPGSSTARLEAAWWVMDTVGADACSCPLLRATRGFSFQQKRQAGTRKEGQGRASPCPAQSQRRLCFSSCNLV